MSKEKPDTRIYGVEKAPQEISAEEAKLGEGWRPEHAQADESLDAGIRTLAALQAMHVMKQFHLAFLRDTVNGAPSMQLQPVSIETPKVVLPTEEEIAEHTPPPLLTPSEEEVAELAGDDDFGKKDADRTQTLHALKNLKEEHLINAKSALRDFCQSVHEGNYGAAPDYLNDVKSCLEAYFRLLQTEIPANSTPQQRQASHAKNMQEVGDVLLEFQLDAMREFAIDEKMTAEQFAAFREHATSALQLFFADPNDLARA